MFTGIIKDLGKVCQVKKDNGRIHFFIESEVSPTLEIDQSIAHNGVCLTVTATTERGYWVAAVGETLDKTTLNQWQKGKIINLEKALQMGNRLDGHLVQGHVDTVGRCSNILETDGDYLMQFKFSDEFAPFIIEKGSICLNGISLTTFSVTKNSFSVTIIPYTLEHTSLKNLKVRDSVNLEFDIFGKYLVRQQELSENKMG